jgi:pyruvate dehydrogenase E2 component (dihydrolipoamide acetyltransferase)
MSDFVMPSLGADMAEGTLLEWYVKPGARVHRGAVVALVDTSKAEIEIEVFDDGVVDEILVEPGTRVPVGTPLARISALAAAEVAPTNGAAPPPSLTAPLPAPAAPSPIPASVHRPRISPIARRVAKESGIDVGTLSGTGPGGAITKIDVERALGNGAPTRPVPASPTAPATTPASTAAERLAARRAGAIEATAVLMARSKREIPHYYLGLDIDVGTAIEWLDRVNADRSLPQRIRPAALFIKAVALAVRKVPELNGFWDPDAFRPGKQINVGVAISLRGGGLVAPAIRNADTLSLDDVMAALRDLVQRTRQGRLRSGEMSSGTITVTNLGDRGVDYVQGVIYPPQVALVGFGRVREVARAVDGLIGVRPIVTATLAGDHRASEGHRGSIFLNAVASHLEHPEEL